MENILSVRELNRKIRQVFEVKFPYIWVKGEISSCARPSSGHLYFSLKDGDELLNCVWFKQNQGTRAFDPITGEVFEDGPKPSIAQNLRDGQEIICAGKLSIYAPRGQYQLIVELAEETGLGQLHVAFEKLKQKLSHEGLFDHHQKKPLPEKIKNVAVITAPTGAVIHDFLRICQGRGQNGSIYIYPSLVQGTEAPQMLIKALKQAEKGFIQNGKTIYPDVIALIRGGGSLEDLWAFNSEELARAIYACPIPIITGIGHEPDQSIADYVADLRAATPSHVAQIIWQDRKIMAQGLDDMEDSILKLAKLRLNYYENQVMQFSKNLNLLSPQNKLKAQLEQVNHYGKNLQNIIFQKLKFSQAEVKYLGQSLISVSPNLEQYYEKLSNLSELMERGLKQELSQKEQTWVHLHEKLSFLGQKLLVNYAKEVNELELKLASHNPITPLNKGYFLAEKLDAGGKVMPIRSIHDLEINDQINLHLNGGQVESKVSKIRPMNFNTSK